MRNNKLSKKRRTRKNGGSAGEEGWGSQTNWVNRSRPMVGFPDRMITTLKFFSAPIPALVGLSSAAFRYTPTNAFDVEPLLGGITMPGFDEFAAVYASYRVLASRITVKVVGASISPLTVIVLPLNADPGASPAVATIIAWRSSPYAKAMMVGTGGSPAVTIQNSMTTAKIYGSNSVTLDDSFASLVTTGPINNWYWAIGFYQNVVFAANPVYTDIQIEVDVQFYDRKFLQT